MKIDIIDENKLVIYLYNNVDKINFKDESSIQVFLKNLFVKLNDYYDIKIEGYYDVLVYIDSLYGIILDLNKDDFDYYDYYCNKVDMKITIKSVKFLYLVDYYNYDLNRYDVYKLFNNIYLLPKKKLNNVELAYLVENSKIIYNSDDIIKKAIKISF